MKRLIAVLPLAALMMLAGCSAPGTTGAEPTATQTLSQSASPNQDACEDFSDLVGTVPDELASDTNANDMWEGVRVKFDDVALKADGVTQDRMLELVDEWPELTDVLLGRLDDFNGKVEAVYRACVADGVDVDEVTLRTE